jgi:mannose/cellobiose epimerase-like protein (N-acyl-D-glucosamine 2-epimerase family)
MKDQSVPDFESPDFLRTHIDSILAFYAPNVFDSEGGFFHHFLDDGRIYDHQTRHLVSSTRFVFNHANAFLQSQNAVYRDWTAHGMAFLQDHHLQPSGHYAWQLKAGKVDDGRAMAYGHAFVILAASWALRLNIAGARETLYATWNFMESQFWEPDHNAYADERDTSLEVLSPYRGQNANMHTVEALIAAYEATGDRLFLERAKQVARQFCILLAGKADGQIWEHYTRIWDIDWNYNIDKPDDLFKPWGFQPGHQIEWSKLLLQLDALEPEDWYLDTARQLFDTAMAKGWDAAHGGLVYGYAPDGEFSDAHKYFWVQAEGIAAAWRLFSRTGDDRYRQDYNRLWGWSWQHLVDHTYGAWYRILSRDGQWISAEKSPAGKVDYHTMGACWDVLQVMQK